MTAMEIFGWAWNVAAVGFIARVVLPLIWHGDLQLTAEEDKPRGESAPATRPAHLAP